MMWAVETPKKGRIPKEAIEAKLSNQYEHYRDYERLQAITGMDAAFKMIRDVPWQYHFEFMEHHLKGASPDKIYAFRVTLSEHKLERVLNSYYAKKRRGHKV